MNAVQRWCVLAGGAGIGLWLWAGSAALAQRGAPQNPPPAQPGVRGQEAPAAQAGARGQGAPAAQPGVRGQGAPPVQPGVRGQGAGTARPASRNPAGATAVAAPSALGQVVAYEAGKSITVEIRRRGGEASRSEFTLNDKSTIELRGDAKEIQVGMPVSVWTDKDSPKVASRIVAGANEQRGRGAAAPAAGAPPATTRRPVAPPAEAPAETAPPAAKPSRRPAK